MAAALSSKKITFPSKNPAGDAQGIVIGDAAHSPRGLIVIHEWWGMNEQVQKEALEIATDGKFTVLVADMYRGKVAIDREEAGHYIEGLDWSGAIEDMTAGANYLKSIGCTKVGVTGFCLGGALAFAAAALCPEISAAAPFYGLPLKFGITKIVDITTIKVPVQGHFGELDDIVGFSSPADYMDVRDKLAAVGAPFELCTYNAGHAFTNPTNPNYNKEAVELAFSRIYAFFTKHLA